MHRIAVLGGGITGLAAAYRCRELAAQHGLRAAVTVLESSERVGGCIETRCEDGFVLEMGPDSLITEKPAAIELARRLGLAGELTPVRSEYRGARVVRAGRMIPIPDDFRLFMPLALRGLLTGKLFTPVGAARAALEPLVRRRRGAGDESLASFVTRRFGREILERLAQPLIGGIYSGDPERLSMRATLPYLLEMERTHGSLIRGMRAAARAANGGTSPHRLVSMRDGLGTLAKALERELGDAVRTHSKVMRLQRGARPHAPWTISLRDGDRIDADFLICALPAYAAAQLVQELEPQAAGLLRKIGYHSVATVTMVYPSHDIPSLPPCTGFVVPASERRSITAATFSTQKYAGRAPDGCTVLRAFTGGAMQPWIAALDDAELAAAVRTEFRELLGIAVPPQRVIVRRWPNALPEYSLGHVDRVAEIEALAAGMGGFAFAGSAYHGVGIADCVRSGEKAAMQTVGFTSAVRAHRSVAVHCAGHNDESARTVKERLWPLNG